MRLPTEDAVRRQLMLLESNRTTIADVIAVIEQLSSANRDSQQRVSETLHSLRSSGELSPEVEPLMAPFVIVPRLADGATVDLQSGVARPRSESPSAVAVIEAGRVLRERYVVQDRLGAGGTGTVYRALDLYRASLPEAQQCVALKVLHAGSDCAEHTITRLRSELHCAQTLSHRNIVNVFEMDRDADVVFFTMELLEGELLSDLLLRLRPAALRRMQAWQIISQLGAGLAYAHGRGVVHGDLKPQNIWVTREGEIRILDFGSAQKFTRTESRPGHPDFAPRSGTPAYASCEQLEGRRADPRDDVYALSCIAHELLSGAHPFDSRPATLVRDFGVTATRPSGLSGRQWRTLQSGLTWHRAGRSMGVPMWLRKLSNDMPEVDVQAPLSELTAAHPPPPKLHSPLAAMALALVLAVGVCAVQWRGSSADRGSVTAPGLVQAAQPLAPTLAAQTASPSERAADSAQPAAISVIPEKVPAKTAPLALSVEGYEIHAGDRFVELRVRRNLRQKDTPFLWWTEPATALQGVDYVHQAKAIQTFPADGHSTRIYVKLLPDSVRSRRDYFYVAIAQPGRGHAADKVIRTQVWLPVPRDQMQASR